MLVLDEPTNDLDTDTLAALEDLLDSWPGTLLVVSHDRYLVERVADTVVALFGDGRITHLPGGVEEYLGRVALTEPPPRPSSRPTSRPSGVDTRAAKKELVRLERTIARLEQRVADLHGQLAEHATDYEKIATLDAELRAVQAEKSQAEDAWLALADDA